MKVANTEDYREPDGRDGPPVLLSSHVFQDPFPALLNDGANKVGGSATVPAKQTLHMPDGTILFGPSQNPSDTVESIPQGLQAVAFDFLGHTFHDHDEWFHYERRHKLSEVLEGTIRTQAKHGCADVLYSHMPVSGNSAQDVAHMTGNPHVYLGHAWEHISIRHFPARAIKLMRLQEEYRLVSKADMIIANTEWERNHIAQYYSKLPRPDEIQEAIEVGMSNGQILSRSDLDLVELRGGIKAVSDNIRSKHGLLTRAEILAKTIVNPLGVEVEYFNPEERRRIRERMRAQFLEDNDMPQDALIFGSVGRIHPQKDPKRAIDMFAAVMDKADYPDKWFLALIGPYTTDDSGAYSGYAEEVIDHASNLYPEIVDKIKLTGSMPPLEGHSMLDIGIESSRFETWGLSFQERLACGVPTVSFPNEVYSELYADSGLTFTGDREEFADVLFNLAQKPKHREEYGQRCAAAGKRYTWHDSVNGLRRNILKKFGGDA